MFVNIPEANAVCLILVDSTIASVVVTDDEYPQKSAFLIAQELREEFYRNYDPKEMSHITSN